MTKDPRVEAAARVIWGSQIKGYSDALEAAHAALSAADKAESDTYNVPGNAYESAIEGRKAFRQKYREAREALIEAREHLRKNRSSWNGPQFQAIWAINAALGEDPAEDRPFHQPLPTPPETPK